MKEHEGKVEFTSVFKQCKKEDCLKCAELACPVNGGKVAYDAVTPFIAKFNELRERSRFATNPTCFYGDCDTCENVSCGVWHGLAPEPQMPEHLKDEWENFWEELEAVLAK